MDSRSEVEELLASRRAQVTPEQAQLADQAGTSLIELAIAFVLRHPAITSAIIGPRTMDHLESQLTAAEVRAHRRRARRHRHHRGPRRHAQPRRRRLGTPALAPAGIDVSTRELLTFAILISLGGADPQAKGHAAANFNVGNTRQQLLDVITVLVPFIGYPRSLNSLAAVNEASKREHPANGAPAVDP